MYCLLHSDRGSDEVQGQGGAVEGATELRGVLWRGEGCCRCVEVGVGDAVEVLQR